MIILKLLTFDEERDFPYYRHNPRLSKGIWLILLLLIPVSYICYILFSFDELLSSIIFCMVLLVPLLYFSNWDYKLIFQRPTKNEIILAFLMFVIYLAYSLLMASVLEMFQLMPTSPPVSSDITFVSLVSLLFSMMAEELLKFIPLMFFMRVFFKYTNKRNLSFVSSMIIVLVFFAFLHYDPSSTSIASVLLLQGLGSLVEMYGYAKTKNLLVPYMSHLFTDAFSFIIIMMGL